jgi:hypothetical protein
MSRASWGDTYRQTYLARTGAGLPSFTARLSSSRRKNPYTGQYQVSELVIYNGQPAHRRVSLFVREANGFRLVRQTWSDPITGRYTFSYVAAGVYFAIAEDYLRQKNMVAADPIQAVPMS